MSTHSKHYVVAAAIVVNPDGEVLLAQRPRHKKIAPGIWHLPGGHVEHGETPEQAVVRELQEEFRLDVHQATVFDTFAYGSGHETTTGLVFVCFVDNTDEMHYDAEDTEDIRWVNDETFKTLLPHDDKDYGILEKFFLHDFFSSKKPTHHNINQKGDEKILNRKLQHVVDGGDITSSLDVHERYQKSFDRSGYHKGKTVVRQFCSLGETVASLQKYIYVSIGASVGSEAQYFLEYTPIPFAILFEKDGMACNVARRRLDPKRSLIINGDIYEDADVLRKVIVDAQKRFGVDGVLFSAQAILHELPRRCRNFEWSTFFHNLLWDWKRCAFISREPCYPCNWPEKVEISVQGVPSHLLKRFGDVVCRHLNFSDNILICGPDYISTTTRVAIEIIHKLFYIDDFAYEIQEAPTDISPDIIIPHIEAVIGSNTVFESRLNSSSFCINYRDLGIDARTADGKHLPMPLSFFSVSALKS